MYIDEEEINFIIERFTQMCISHPEICPHYYGLNNKCELCGKEREENNK